MLNALHIDKPEHQVAVGSDFHFNHDKPYIYERRNFAGSDEHKNGLIHNWNAVIDNNFTVFHLGDLVIKDPDAKHFWELIRRLNFGTLYLLWGNHNSGQKAVYVDALKYFFPDAVDKYNHVRYEVYPLEIFVDHNPNKRIVFLSSYAEFYLNHQLYTLSHYPILSHNELSKRSIMLCGHSHQGLPLTSKDAGKGLRLDVSMEALGRPFLIPEIKNLLKDRDIDSYDYHGKTPITK